MTFSRLVGASTAVAVALSLAACGSGKRVEVERAPNLALACQTMECTCSAESGSIFEKTKTTEILWRPNGDAYCPKGFVLEPVKKDP